MPVDDIRVVGASAAQPRFIGPDERPLFTWHHAPPRDLRRGAAVVICPPLGYEYMSSYRTSRILAERLASLGFDAVRLDYDGTGDSFGSCTDSDRVGAWRESIRLAIGEGQRLAGSKPVALVGLRAGALLALQAVSGNAAVERLVLWNPFPSGRAYVRELKAISRLSERDDAADEGEADAAEVVNAEGHTFTRQTLDELARWTVHDVAAGPSDVLVIDRDDRPDDADLMSHLTLLGSRVTRRRSSGTAEMLAPPHLAKVPEQSVDEIATWLGEWRAPARSSAALPLETVGGTRTDHVTLCRRDYHDEAVRFGPRGRLFGMLASPTAASNRPALLLLNTGGGHHVGPHRLYVPLARDLAARGHLVLRFDLGGIGDSDPPEDTRAANGAYPAHMLDDAREAIAFLRSRGPHRKVVAAGLCSGGWLAFQIARAGLDVDAVVSVNPPLYLRDGADGLAWLNRARELRRYQQSMRDPAKWIKGLRGGASYTMFTRVAAAALARRVALRISGVLGTALPDGFANDLCGIAARGVRTLFVFSRGDNGLAYFNVHAEPALRRRRARSLIEHLLIDGAGHAFRPLAAQHALTTILTDFLNRHP
jgi:alpha-beta hydrolase superfamily lysophospholipase